MKTQSLIISILANILAHQALCQTGLHLSDSCTAIQLVEIEDHQGLRASCAADNGTSYCTTLDINDCFALKGGNIMPQNNGHFQTEPTNSSCTACDMQPTLELDCSCPDKTGTMKTRDVVLDVFITNKNGVLNCFDHYGDLTSGCDSASSAGSSSSIVTTSGTGTTSTRVQAGQVSLS